MRLSDHLDLERIKVPLTGISKEAVIRELVELAEPDPARREEIVYSLLQREAIQSTAIGREVAIPHCIAEIGSELVLAAGLHREGVDFGAGDGMDARIFVLVISSPRGRSQHLRMLTAISRLLSREECRQRLLASEDPPAMLRNLLAQEEELAS